MEFLNRLIVRAMVVNRNSNNEPREMILLSGYDCNHWMIVMVFLKDPASTREQMIETYLNTLATILGRSDLIYDVILDLIQIFNTHEWLAPKLTVYFYCQGENKTILPDMKEKHFVYQFKGHESWQPLTELPDKKCKRWGLYEMDEVKTDDIYDKWELCYDDFVDGNYVHYKEKEFNATFSCPECITPVITIK